MNLVYVPANLVERSTSTNGAKPMRDTQRFAQGVIRAVLTALTSKSIFDAVVDYYIYHDKVS